MEANPDPDPNPNRNPNPIPIPIPNQVAGTVNRGSDVIGAGMVVSGSSP